ncbi:unnamed protein product [Cylicocyclus nassatus]|uniref:Uncharacterized protein n=1 Tax=Cylicocyclus nassatus TaxID=53992 RepID=A0AA36DK09_CYLNA|nr:unnamed protein product [Cylicocyclus nassatus]
MNAHIKGMDKFIRKIEKRNHIAEGDLQGRGKLPFESQIASLTSAQHPVLYNASFGCQVGQVFNAETQTEAAEVVDVGPALSAEEQRDGGLSCGRDGSLILLDEDNTNEDESMDDEQYLGHLIQEVEAGEEIEVPPKREDETSEQIKNRQEECRNLLEDIDQPEQVLRIFPYRMYGEAPDGGRRTPDASVAKGDFQRQVEQSDGSGDDYYGPCRLYKEAPALQEQYADQ